jgi:hypothetical protein
VDHLIRLVENTTVRNHGNLHAFSDHTAAGQGTPTGSATRHPQPGF